MSCLAGAVLLASGSEGAKASVAAPPDIYIVGYGQYLQTPDALAEPPRLKPFREPESVLDQE
jgi:hypothetical protein